MFVPKVKRIILYDNRIQVAQTKLKKIPHYRTAIWFIQKFYNKDEPDFTWLLCAPSSSLNGFAFSKITCCSSTRADLTIFIQPNQRTSTRIGMAMSSRWAQVQSVLTKEKYFQLKMDILNVRRLVRRKKLFLLFLRLNKVPRLVSMCVLFFVKAAGFCQLRR